MATLTRKGQSKSPSKVKEEVKAQKENKLYVKYVESFKDMPKPGEYDSKKPSNGKKVKEKKDENEFNYEFKFNNTLMTPIIPLFAYHYSEAMRDTLNTLIPFRIYKTLIHMKEYQTVFAPRVPETFTKRIHITELDKLSYSGEDKELSKLSYNVAIGLNLDPVEKIDFLEGILKYCNSIHNEYGTYLSLDSARFNSDKTKIKFDIWREYKHELKLDDIESIVFSINSSFKEEAYYKGISNVLINSSGYANSNPKYYGKMRDNKSIYPGTNVYFDVFLVFKNTAKIPLNLPFIGFYTGKFSEYAPILKALRGSGNNEGRFALRLTSVQVDNDKVNYNTLMGIYNSLNNIASFISYPEVESFGSAELYDPMSDLAANAEAVGRILGDYSRLVYGQSKNIDKLNSLFEPHYKGMKRDVGELGLDLTVTSVFIGRKGDYTKDVITKTVPLAGCYDLTEEMRLNLRYNSNGLLYNATDIGVYNKIIDMVKGARVTQEEGDGNPDNLLNTITEDKKWANFPYNEFIVEYVNKYNDESRSDIKVSLADMFISIDGFNGTYNPRLYFVMDMDFKGYSSNVTTSHLSYEEDLCLKVVLKVSSVDYIENKQEK